jgi:uncharacterized protein
MSMQVQPASGFRGELSIDDLIARGMAYASGRAGRVDLVEAHKCFNLAAAAGASGAARQREEIASEMSPGEIAEALRAAREWLSRRRAGARAGASPRSH